MCSGINKIRMQQLNAFPLQKNYFAEAILSAPFCDYDFAVLKNILCCND